MAPAPGASVGGGLERRQSEPGDSSCLPDFIEIGSDAINPVQVSAVGMGDTAALSREFGADLTSWGGIDTQRVLPRGTPDDVREQVRRRIADLTDDGGFVLAAVHDIQEDVPVENVLAMVDAAVELGGSEP